MHVSQSLLKHFVIVTLTTITKCKIYYSQPEIVAITGMIKPIRNMIKSIRSIIKSTRSMIKSIRSTIKSIRSMIKSKRSMIKSLRSMNNIMVCGHNEGSLLCYFETVFCTECYGPVYVECLLRCIVFERKVPFYSLTIG